MNYFNFVKKQYTSRNKKLQSLKKTYRMNIKKNNIISVGYHEYDKEEIKLEFYKGACQRIKGSGVNTKIILLSRLDRTNVKLNFFLYNPFLFDLMKHS